MASAANRIVICGAGIAGIAAAYHLALAHGHDDIVIVDPADYAIVEVVSA